MNLDNPSNTSFQKVIQVLTYGRCTVIACFATMFLLYGLVLNTFTIFVDPIVEDFETTRGLLSYAMMIGAVAMGMAAPITGILMDKIGVKRVMVAGALMIGLGILAASRATALVHLYVAYAFIGIGMACATIIACSLVISNWFVSRRGSAMGVMAMGTSIGGMVMSPVAGWIIQAYGWRTAYVFNGSIILLIAFPMIAFLLRSHPADAGLEPYTDSDLPSENADTDWGLSVKESFSSIAFWQIAVLMFISGVVTTGIGVHIVPCLKDLGHSLGKSTWIWSIALGVMTVSKFLFGPIADRWGPKNTVTASCVMMAGAMVILTFAVRYEFAILFGAIFGFGVGAPLTVFPLLVGKALGVKHFGALYGVLNLLSIIGAALGPVALGEVFDARGSYMLGIYIFVGLMLLSGVIALFIRPATHRNCGEC
jgi:MFS family permease